MKITGHESATLNIPEDDPLANMPEEAGRTRPVVTLRLRTDAGIEGIGVTLWGGDLTGSLRSAIDTLSALTIAPSRTGSKWMTQDDMLHSAIAGERWNYSCR